MKGELHNILREKLASALIAGIPVLTRREIRLPQVPGKAMAVIGMRRSGKTCFNPRKAYPIDPRHPMVLGERMKDEL